MTLFAGSVVFIDDELGREDSQAFALLQEIEATGRPVVRAKSLPDDQEAWFEHWRSLAFVVLDWDLSPGSSGSTGGATLSAYRRKELYRFVRSLMERIYCPIVIISAEDTEDIRRQMSENADFTTESGAIDARIAIFAKDVLMSRIVAHLSDWVANNPAFSALKAWEQEYESAKNKLFIDLNELEPDWPAYVWCAANDDGVDPAFELASAISANLLNRLNPVAFDVDAIVNFGGAISGASRRRVSQGRTLVPEDRLHKTMVLPGDIFVLNGAPEGEVWINVSPVCQTVCRPRRGDDGTEKLEPVRLHLLKGVRQAMPTTKRAFNSLDEKGRGPNSVLIHTVLDAHPYLFAFGEAQIVDWDSVKDRRVGRLLPPYITRVQQMHSAYVQSVGLPKVTSKLYGLS